MKPELVLTQDDLKLIHEHLSFEEARNVKAILVAMDEFETAADKAAAAQGHCPAAKAAGYRGTSRSKRCTANRPRLLSTAGAARWMGVRCASSTKWAWGATRRLSIIGQPWSLKTSAKRPRLTAPCSMPSTEARASLGWARGATYGNANTPGETPPSICPFWHQSPERPSTAQHELFRTHAAQAPQPSAYAPHASGR